MRRRRHRSGARVLLAAFAGSALIHLILWKPAELLIESYLEADPSRVREPVEVVQVSEQAWSENMRAAREAVRRRGPQATPSPAEADKKKPEPEEKKEKKEPDSELDGQIVEVPPTQDDSPNPDAEYLSKYNTNVEKESVARDRDPSKKRVTNELQTEERAPARPRQKSVPTKGLTVEGEGEDGGEKGEASADETPKKAEDRQFVLEVPDLKRRDEVDLELSEAPGRSKPVSNRTASEPLKGNSDRFRFEMGSEKSASSGNQGEGGGGKKSLPSLEALAPTFGTMARISGSPSRDYVEGVPEGDGTFLNTKQFKYATFFYRVRDSVASHWDDMVAREYRRRDPSGSIYGVRDRSTLLHIRLTPDGSLTEVRVAQSSGVGFLDDVAVQAFRMAEPFPNPPAGIVDEDGTIRFNFQFVVTMRSSSPLNLFR